MMLRAFLPGIAQRYAIVGLALGTLLPIFGLLSETVLADRSQQVQFRLDDPFHVLLFVTPLFASIAFYWFGFVKADLLEKIKIREKVERRLLHLSLHDRLTGLPNRMALEKEILDYVSARAKGRLRPAVMLLDLDKFKHVNDTLGHDAGDELLCIFSQRIVSSLGPLARLFRLGGDEFVISIAGSPDEADVERLCRLIHTEVGAPFELKSGKAVIGVSVGISFMEHGDLAMADVMKRADLALYAAKEISGSSHIFHSTPLAEDMLERMRVEQEIAGGLVRGEFFLEYQPIVSASSRELKSFEALVRWKHPARGVLTPEDFLAIAERSGHIMALGKFVVGRAIEDASRWPQEIGVAVNVTGDEFRDPHFTEHVRTALDIQAFDPSRLTIEITESIFTVDIAVVRKGLAELRAIGVLVAIDDFGVGFSSINHLKEFPVDRLKIDRSFTEDVLSGGRETELVDIILRLGRIFNVRTTIEGIENEDQFELVRALGVGDVQGFLISRPVPANTVIAMVARPGNDDLSGPLRISA
ncbi:MAG: diguanylate cyclase domain protein [Rhizobium sp.]|nr:diguanylate cyclase domain protein [Rhizobium sp.]